MKEITVTYNYPIVIISILIAIFACFTTLDLVGRVYKSNKKNKMLWLLAGATTMGIGIWSMHFTGMLAIETGVYVVYDGLTTIFSMIIAIIASFFAFYSNAFKRHLIISAILMGLGISSMHYIGMHGMQIEAYIVHNYFIVILSVFIAITLSLISLLVFSKVKSDYFYIYHIPIALLMGLGISGMHYTAMESMTLYEMNEPIVHSHSLGWEFTVDSNVMLIILVITIFILIGITQTMSIRDKKINESKINYMAHHDHLTGLPNRFMLNDNLQKALANCKHNHQSLAVMFIDLDRFKFINDTMGHSFGDVLLIRVSERLIKSIREEDIVARQGGDEFIVLLENIEPPQVKQIAERILNSFSEPFIVEEREYFISPSIGITIYPNDGNDIETLTKNADKAMYSVKKRDKNNYISFISMKRKNSLKED